MNIARWSTLLLLSLVLVACAQSPTPTPIPTATPIPPSPTPVPSTATPVPPTATPVRPTLTATPIPPTPTPVIIVVTATPIPPTPTVTRTFTPVASPTSAFPPGMGALVVVNYLGQFNIYFTINNKGYDIPGNGGQVTIFLPPGKYPFSANIPVRSRLRCELFEGCTVTIKPGEYTNITLY